VVLSCADCKGTGRCLICVDGFIEEGSECRKCEGTGECLCQVSDGSNDSVTDKPSSQGGKMDQFIGKSEGVDVNGNRCKLGDRDSMGHIVGFIDDDYNCWETLAERDGSLTAGRYSDAMTEWERDKSKPCPNPLEIAKETCLDPENVPLAVEEAKDSWEFIIAMRPAARAKMVEDLVERLRALDNPSIHDIRKEVDRFMPKSLRSEEE
jgi:hypothetical protein